MLFQMIKMISAILLIHLVSISATAEVFYQETDYGTVREQLQNVSDMAFKQIYKSSCFKESADFVTKSKYKCGELPVGKIINKNDKSIFQYRLKKAKLGKVKNVSIYLTKNINFKMLLDRNQRSSESKLSIIDTGKNTNIGISRRIDDNIFVRHVPRGKKLLSMVCTYVPGFNVEVPDEKIHLKGVHKKKILFFTIKSGFTSKSTLSTGKLKTEDGRVCGVFETSVSGNLNKPKVKTDLVKIEYPKLNGIDVKGLKVEDTDVKLQGFLLKLVSSILKFLGVMDIPKLIAHHLEKEIQKEIDKTIKIQVSDVKSGVWLKKVLEAKIAKDSFVKDVFKVFKNQIADTHETPIIHKEKVENECYAMMDGIEKERNLKLDEAAVNKTCKNLVIKVAVIPFHAKPSYKDLGCYENFYSVHNYRTLPVELKNTFWTKDCKLSSRVEVTGGNTSSKTRACIVNGIIAKNTRKEIQKKCEAVAIKEFLAVPKVNEKTSEEILRSENPIAYMESEGLDKSDRNKVTKLLGL